MSAQIFAIAAALLLGYLFAIAIVSANRRKQIVFDYEQGVKFVNGRFITLLGPGHHSYNPKTTTIRVVSGRLRFDLLRGQEILTQDGVTIGVTLLVTYRVSDAKLAVSGVEDFSQALHLTAQEELRNLISTMAVDDVLTQREQLAATLKERLIGKLAAFGLELNGIGIRDLMFSGALKQAFAASVTARKEAGASLERARGEQATLRSLANTARLLDGNPNLFQLRLLQSLGESSGHTVVLGLPAESMKSTAANPGAVSSTGD